MGKTDDCMRDMYCHRISDWFACTTIHLKRRYKMKKNMGSVDRTVRTIIAVIVAILYFTGQISGTVAIILGILAIVFLLTSFVGTCPLYLPFGLSTRKGAK